MAGRLLLLITLCAFTLVCSQRAPFAGTRPIGYPELADRFVGEQSNAALGGENEVGLGNRFGEGPVGPTERLPIDANGDRELIDRISKWPVDQQPFWYLNWKQIEANRQNPQTQPVNSKPSFVP